MRQRSLKTQRRVKKLSHRLHDPYAITGDVSCEESTISVGGLITPTGVLQLVVVLALSSFLFSGALLFCVGLLAVLGVALLHHQSDAKTRQQRQGLSSVLHRLVALRRSALDYSLTLSIAPRNESHQTESKVPRIAVVPSSIPPQKVVATMALKQETWKLKPKCTMTSIANGASIVTLDVLPRISSDLLETADELYSMEKPRTKSEPKQVLRRRPLLPLKAKVMQLRPVQEIERSTPPPKAEQEEVMSDALTTSVKAVQALTKQKKAQSSQKNEKSREAPRSTTAETRIQPPSVPFKGKGAAALPKPKPKAVKVVSSTASINDGNAVCAVAPLPDLPKRKLSEKAARRKPAAKQVVTRKVSLYLKSKVDPVLKKKEQELKQEVEGGQDEGHGHELEDFAFSLGAFPPLSQPTVPQTSASLSATDVMEPNFLLDIELEPISKPEKKSISLESQRFKSEGNAELRLMLDELDAMSSELDIAMARCTSLLYEEK
uniref:Uncharacterized protein n=1 Tax=Hyaloperonospora arabidopsidis (strain Emoy2) TaxID=559515 RepID=M4BRK4_HYAAE